MFLKIAALFFSVFLTVSAQAQVYRWVDSKGKPHVTDSPPPRSAQQSKSLNPADEKRNRRRTVKPITRPSKSFKYFNVILYTHKECFTECELARNLLKKRGIAFSEKIIKDDLDAEWLKRQTGETITPSITVGGDVYKGWAEEGWNNLLDKNGFPQNVASAQK